MTQKSYHKLRTIFAIFPGGYKYHSALFLRQHYQVISAKRSLCRLFLDLLVALCFRIWIPARAFSIRKRHKLSLREVFQNIRLSFAGFMDPNDVALLNIQDEKGLNYYMRRFELAPIMRQINPAGWQPDCALNNKELFYDRCLSYGLPHPQIVGLYVDGTITWRNVLYEKKFPDGFIAKPVADRGGARIKRLKVAFDSPSEQGNLERFIAESLEGEIGPYLIQEFIAPHPLLVPIACDALPTIRMTTIMNEKGAPELTTQVIRMPSEYLVAVDNLKAGGMIAPLDDSGYLGRAIRGRRYGEFTVHPATGQKIKGLQVPYFDEAKELVLKAHYEAFREYTLVGWDLAIAQFGPVLIEGNSKPSVIVAQRANMKGIGETRFGDLIAYHLARSEEEKAGNLS